MRVGTELREARERAGLSAEQIAERTKIQVHKVEALENGSFDRLPDGIYLDGIVGAYAREVAIKPEPLIERVHYERTERVTNWEDGPEDLDTFPQEQAANRDNFGRKTDPSIAAIQPEPRVVAASAPAMDILLDHAQIGDPLEATDSEMAVLPGRYEPAQPARGLGRLVVPLVLVLAVAGWGAYLYQTGGSVDRDPPADLAASALRRTSPQQLPSERTASPGTVRQDTKAGAVAETTVIITGTPTPQDSTISDVPPTPTPPSHPAEPRAASAAPPPAERVTPDTTANDVSGSWTLATNVESSSYARFAGLHLGYEIQLEQAGDRVTGAGRKVTQNGDGIGLPAQTPILVAGTIDGDRLTLTFKERGARRPTEGKFVLLLDESGTLRGRFSSTAAQSSGTVEARRLPR